MTGTYMSEMKSSLEALLEEFSKNMIEDYKTVKKILLCVMCCFGEAV